MKWFRSGDIERTRPIVRLEQAVDGLEITTLELRQEIERTQALRKKRKDENAKVKTPKDGE